MKINIEFESVTEMKEFAEAVGGTCKCGDKKLTATPIEEKEVKKDNSKENRKDTSKKQEKAKSEDKSKTENKANDKSKETSKVEAEKVGVDNSANEDAKDVEATEEGTKVTKEELRKACTKVLKMGKAAAVKKIFEKYDAEKLPEVKEEDFGNVLKDVEALQ